MECAECLMECAECAAVLDGVRLCLMECARA